jgi:hypothetical protein
MKVSPVTLSEYIEFISQVSLISIFQYPQYHYIQELIHPGRVRLEPFKIEENDRTILVPLVIEEWQRGYPEYIVPFNSVISDKPLAEKDYSLILDTLVNRRPFVVRVRASLQNPHPFSEALRLMKLKISKKNTYVIDLPPAFEDWLTTLSANTRYKVRKRMNRAESAGLSVRERGAEGLDDFLRLFYIRFHDHPEVVKTLPAVFFHQLFRQMPQGTVKFHEVCYKEKVIVSWLLIYGSPECFAHSSSYDKEYKDLYAGDLLSAHVIKKLIESGRQTFNLGGTGKSDTLSVFKEKAGAREVIYDLAVWKNRWHSFRKSFYFPLSNTFSIKKHFLIKQNLALEQPASELPQGIEWFLVEEEKELENLISEDYSLKGQDEKGKTFMNESIARTRLTEKQMLNLVFRNKQLVYTRSLVPARALPFVHLIPSMPLTEKEIFTWHANTPAFFRMLGYHTLFTRHLKHFLKQKGMERFYLSVREDNIPSLKAHKAAGGKIIGFFYVIRWKKKVWCVRRSIRQRSRINDG